MTLHDKILSFLEENETDCDLILGVLYGCKAPGDVTDEISERFIMDCMTAGFEDLVDRAVQLYKEGKE